MKYNSELSQTKMIAFLLENEIKYEVKSDTVGVVITVNEKDLDNEKFEFLFFEQNFKPSKGKISKIFPRLIKK